jgi:DNA-binding PucR family transcriptional regulator
MTAPARRNTSSADPAAGRDALQAEFTDIARRLLAEKRDIFIVELSDELRSAISELVDDPRMLSLMEASVTENVVSVVNYLESGTRVTDLDASSAALSHARTLAQRDIPLSALFRAYRIGHAKFVQLGLEVIQQGDPARHIELAQYLIERSAAFIDKVCEQVGAAYDSERDQWVGDRGGIRQLWIAELLSGRTVDFNEAEAALGYRLGGTHVAVQMWASTDVASVDARAMFEETRRILAASLSPVAHPLLVPHDEREMHAWFPVRSGFELPIDSLTEALRASRALNLHVAVGRSESGIGGFRLTIAQAKRVKDVLLTSTNPMPTAVTYDQLGPVALMASDVDALRRFVVRTLGPLAADGEREETLRETLRTFLGHNRSYAATAQAMIMHRNSVQYRVNQALALCERELAEVDVALDLQVALSAARWLGRPVLNN